MKIGDFIFLDKGQNIDTIEIRGCTSSRNFTIRSLKISKDCKDCIHSRLVISENGYRVCCTLPFKTAKYCIENNYINCCENIFIDFMEVEE